METFLFALGAIGLVLWGLLWLVNGTIHNAEERTRKHEEARINALRKRNEADRMLDDAEYRKRLLDSDND